MGRIGWRFPPLSGGTRQGYTNNDIEAFKGKELIDNLAREICQNSLDAQLDSSMSVKVMFELKKFETRKFDVFTQYEKCLSGCRNYWKNEMDARLSKFIDGAEKILCEETIPVLIAGDYNTKGLTGNHSRELSSSWEALTGSDGVSVKSSDNSAGSYGIGKNAPFACSSLSMVFYNTLAENNERAFIGVARLATLSDESGKATQRVGKYQVNYDEEERWEPIYPENQNVFRDNFTRNERGTDVIIAGFNQSDDWMVNVTKAVLKNFFVAVFEGKLVVELKDNDEYKIIDKDTISQFFSDFSNDKDMTGTVQLYKAFTEPDCKKTTKIIESEDVEVYIKSESNYKRTIANFRATGMLVGTYYKRILQHYAAVVIVRGEKLGELLKDTEPPRHNNWDYKKIDNDKEKRKFAHDCIKQIEDFVVNLLKEQSETITEDTVDAAGVGEYLPDEVTEAENNLKGDDILKVKVQIGKVHSNPAKRATSTRSGMLGEGKEQDDTIRNAIRNHKRNPRMVPPSRSSKPVVPNPDSTDSIAGVTPGFGAKTVETPNLIFQRAFPVNYSQGLYKIIIKPSENYENLFIECFAVGEDGQSEALALESFTYNKKKIGFQAGKAGPLKVKANMVANFFAKFQNKEKMKIDLHLTEVSIK